MSSTTTLVQAAATVPYSMVFSMTLYIALLGGVAVFFRPLLVGIGRALYLTVRPRRAKTLARKPAGQEAVDAAEISLMNIRH